MDFVTFLAIAVAVLVVMCAYLLFKDVPRFGLGPGPRRSNRRP